MDAVGEVTVPRGARTFVRAFLAAFVLAGLLGVEAWPLTGFRLFANVRTDRQEAVRAVVVAADGSESNLPFWRLPPSYRGSVQVLQRFSSLDAAERAAVCAAWAGALADAGVEAPGIRVYRVTWRLSDRAGDRVALPDHRALVADCAEAPA